MIGTWSTVGEGGVGKIDVSDRVTVLIVLARLIRPSILLIPLNASMCPLSVWIWPTDPAGLLAFVYGSPIGIA